MTIARPFSIGVAASALAFAVALPAGGLAASPQAAPARAPAAFAKCAACHSVVRGAPAGIGPNLVGVSGRKAGSRPGFAYSPAMRKSGLTWNRATLQRYIANPGAAVPGTTMPPSGVTPAESAVLASWLAALK